MGLVSGLLQRCGCKKKSGSHELDKIPDHADEKQAEAAQEGGGRAQWASPTEFLLTCIGYSVGLGNVWRFPYLCYKSGGGAFLIPYFIFIVLIGMPLLFMEYSFGQYFGVGGLSIFKKVCPLLQGIGIGYVVLNALVCIYYNVIIALSLYYMFASFTSVLPWGTCGNWWNTPFCGDPTTPDNSTCMNMTNATYETFSSANETLETTLCNLNATLNDTKRTSPSEEYWKYYLLDVKPEHSIDNIGGIRWHMCLCLLLAWIFVILFVCKGIKSTGKVVYFTATFPYVMLTVLVVRGVTLPGAATGILYFVTPNFTALANPEVWFGAATQLFYSTNLAWGGMITMASYNDFKHNCYRDAVVINLVSFVTSLYAGFAVFSVIGYMANEYGQRVEDVIDSGPGLAFIVYPRALGLMPLAPMWSFLFFFMLFLLGIGSQMVDFETVMSGLCDEFPFFRKHRFVTALVVAAVFCLLGLPQVCQGGMYVLQLMDWYSAGFCVMVIAVFEAVAINWLYGNNRFVKNVKEMLGSFPRPGMWWRVCWMVISPAIIFAVLLFKFIDYKRATYGDYKYPMWADMLGWVMSLASVLPIFAVAIYKFIRTDGATLQEKWRRVIRPQLDDRGSTIEVDTKDVDKPPQNDTSGKGVNEEDKAQRDALLSKEEEAQGDSRI